MWPVALSMAGQWQRLTLTVESLMAFKVCPQEKHSHSVRIGAFECI